MDESQKIRAIVVDDEKPIAELMRKYLEDTGLVEVVLVLSNPLEVMDAVRHIGPDVIFLDIEMPQLTGLELAEEISGLEMNTDLVFVTAYNQYAIEAFKVNALDYLMKPVQVNELQRVLKKLSKTQGVKKRSVAERQLRHNEANPGALKVKALGGLNFYNGVSDEPIRWSTSKCCELLAYMVFQKEGASVSKWKLMDILWPEKEDEKSAINLRSTVCRVNKTLKENGIATRIVSNKNTYCLEKNDMIVDAFELEKKALSSTHYEVDTFSGFEAIYEGEFFENLDYDWASGDRQHYARLFIKLGKSIVDERMKQNQLGLVTFQMVNYLIKSDPYNEELHERALWVLNALEGKKAVFEWFYNYQKVLKDEVGIEPNGKLQRVYEEIMMEKRS